MTEPTSAREALIVEAVGEAGRLIRMIEALGPVIEEDCQALLDADTRLHNTLASFESRTDAITENAKVRTVQYLAVRVEESTRRSIEQQSRAMIEAAHAALRSELGVTMQ